MDLETFLVSLYVLIDDWWRADRPPTLHDSDPKGIERWREDAEQYFRRRGLMKGAA